MGALLSRILSVGASSKMASASASAPAVVPCRICKKETGGAPVCPFCGLKQNAKSNIWSASACPAGNQSNGGRPTDIKLHFSIFSPSNTKDVSAALPLH